MNNIHNSQKDSDELQEILEAVRKGGYYYALPDERHTPDWLDPDVALARIQAHYQPQAEGDESDRLIFLNGITCPACNSTGTLFADVMGNVTCSLDKCPIPDYAEALTQKNDHSDNNGEIESKMYDIFVEHYGEELLHDNAFAMRAEIMQLFKSERQHPNE